MLNGLGGSADSLRTAKISMPSTRPSKIDPTGVSWIMPMYIHVKQNSTISTKLSQTRHETITFVPKTDLPANAVSLTFAAFHLESGHE